MADACGDADTTLACTGQSLVNTYTAAKTANLTKMPTIPTLQDFAARNLTARAQLFGCNETDAVTIVWLPLTSYSFPTNINTFDLSESRKRVGGLIANGNRVATQNNDPQWAACLACAILHKWTLSVPDNCVACFQKYCAT